jgi:hypothetical protein
MNNSCEEFDKVRSFDMSIKEYSSDKLPICENCKQQTNRHYTSFGHQTFGDGYKS